MFDIKIAKRRTAIDVTMTFGWMKPGRWFVVAQSCDDIEDTDHWRMKLDERPYFATDIKGVVHEYTENTRVKAITIGIDSVHLTCGQKS